MKFGQIVHVGEVKLNRYIQKEDTSKPKKSAGKDDQELHLYIKPLSDEAAFNKGVEYFSEIVFFYTLILSLASYEIKKTMDAYNHQQHRLNTYDIDICCAKLEIEKISNELVEHKEERDKSIALMEQMKKEMEEMRMETRQLFKDQEAMF